MSTLGHLQMEAEFLITPYLHQLRAEYTNEIHNAVMNMSNAKSINSAHILEPPRLYIVAMALHSYVY